MFSNTSSCSSNRELVIIRFFVDESENIDKFNDITYEISNNYVLDNILSETSNEIIYYVGVRHDVNESDISSETNCLVSRNNYESIDLDIYFKEAESFIKLHKFDISENKEIDSHIIHGSTENKAEEDNLIDELLDYVEKSS